MRKRVTYHSAVFIAILVAAVMVVLNSCKPTVGHVLGGPDDSLEIGVAATTVDTTLLKEYGLTSTLSVLVFYKGNGASLAWFNDGKLLPAADSMLQMVGRAGDYGLSPALYKLDELEVLRNEALIFRFTTPSRLDILLTDAFVSMARHLRHGLSRLVINSHEMDVAYAELLNEALRTGEVRKSLESQEPCGEQYLALKEELKNLLRRQLDPKVDPASTQSQISKLNVNIERWRWEAGPLPERYVFINIPAYQLSVIEGGEAVLQSKVIVGAKSTPTPVLESSIWCLTIYPYWTVPRSITIKEILPKVKVDSSYLSRNLYEVLDARSNTVDTRTIDWSLYDENNFPYYLRQKEGRENALGIVKFRFDNPYGVYLHDTNAPKLFSRKERALSHGCIRMEKAEEFAYYLVRNDTVYSNPLLLEQYFKLKKRTEISVIQPIPIYVRYFTAWAEDGQIVYYPDVYNKDGWVLSRVIL
ncbi:MULTISPECIES: murein L,D-transpeptidase [unclassified Imperialibacter]|uniref:L,D-transpeptidase family protein n=1 Tax=unclassified Imperialibacter TaxID=2629706 RepID=UPI00125ABADA|nr:MULTISPECIES: L,D-transpeptidase family protein [unclassified Imperialibacter]CAD5276471.1 putative L,D-transpeptidase [Imperialibacter sp. 89]CAD5294783.1 putative L,D-transpeptidase [Imperialibacter sp. 75]VVT26826.1 putative L,D-transpeptidase catalytic domain [Imperialibacter sp. EC-SDR9]